MGYSLIIRSWFFIILSIVVAMMLTILPLPFWAEWVRPLWVPAVVFYWALALPERFSIGAAWCVGVLLDVLLGTVLGENALGLTVAVFVVSKLYTRIRLFPMWQQVGVIVLLSLCYLVLLFWMQGLMGQAPLSWQFWMPSITTGLLWPWIFILMRDYRRRFVIR